jgi:hypothetical protein
MAGLVKKNETIFIVWPQRKNLPQKLPYLQAG